MLLISCVLLIALLSNTASSFPTGYNVLFVAVDDMRPSIGAFNFSLAHTPHMDQLAADGLTFKRAFVQYAFCAPSRNSFMSGRRPDTTRVWNFQDHFREIGVGDQWQSLPEYFKNHGYVTAGSGKLYHPTVPPNNDWPKSWTTGNTNGTNNTNSTNSTSFARYYSPECMPPRCPNSIPPKGNTQAGNKPSGIFHCVNGDPPPLGPAAKLRSTSCPANTSADEARFEYQLEDQRIRDSCVDQLESLAEQEKPFFLGCGFHKPHVPWEYPQEFLQHYPSDLNDIPLAKDVHAPIDMPQVAWHYPADVHGFKNVFNGTCNATRSRVFRRSYYAAITYTDYNIGRLLQKVDQLGLTNTTAVVVFGDHGWQLGEHATWAKMTNFEVALRTPLIIKIPWKKQSHGKVTNVLAEAVDLYPTLVEAVGLPPPRSVGEEINGTSLYSVFDTIALQEGPQEKRGKVLGLKNAAYAQFAKPSKANPFQFWPAPSRNATEIMGYTVRVDEWRYTCWFGFDKVHIVPLRNEILGRELYDHRGDNGELDWKGEHVNVVKNPEHEKLVKMLHQMILDYIQLYPVTKYM